MKYKVNLQIVLENGKSKSVTFDSELVETLKKRHMKSAVVEIFDLVMYELELEETDKESI